MPPICAASGNAKKLQQRIPYKNRCSLGNESVSSQVRNFMEKTSSDNQSNVSETMEYSFSENLLEIVYFERRNIAM
jgi:ribosomal protein S20